LRKKEVISLLQIYAKQESTSISTYQMTRVNNNLKVCHKCSSVSSFKGIIQQCDILMDKDCWFSLQGLKMARACTSSDNVKLVVCDIATNASSLLRFLASQSTWGMQFRYWVATTCAYLTGYIWCLDQTTTNCPIG
jgi:hypothetical protein